MKTMLFEPSIVRMKELRPEIVEKLDLDLAVLRDGGFPTGEMLESAPILDRWLVLFTPPHIIQLAGAVSGHPIRRNGRLVTSAVCAIDCVTFRWARTTSRYYRLTRPLREVRFDG
jgi:hypothetical protein